jgi:hypothetical protein
MIHPTNTAELTKALDTWIAGSKVWSDVAHKTFVEMAEKARQDVVMKGDFSFVHAFRKQFAIGEPTQPLNGRTLETQFYILMQTIQDHFMKFGREYERERKRASYMEMLRSGRKEEFLVILRSHLGVTYNDDHCLTQEVWQTFNKEEKAREERQREEEQQQKLAEYRKLREVRDIETEAKRRIAQAAFEQAVQAKMRELMK